jgi:hypothetical protein
MSEFISNHPRASELISIGEEAIAKENDALLRHGGKSHVPLISCPRYFTGQPKRPGTFFVACGDVTKEEAV